MIIHKHRFYVLIIKLQTMLFNKVTMNKTMKIRIWIPVVSKW